MSKNSNNNNASKGRHTGHAKTYFKTISNVAVLEVARESIDLFEKTGDQMLIHLANGKFIVAERVCSGDFKSSNLNPNKVDLLIANNRLKVSSSAGAITFDDEPDLGALTVRPRGRERSKVRQFLEAEKHDPDLEEMLLKNPRSKVREPPLTSRPRPRTP